MIIVSQLYSEIPIILMKQKNFRFSTLIPSGGGVAYWMHYNTRDFKTLIIHTHIIVLKTVFAQPHFSLLFDAQQVCLFVSIVL